MTDRISEAHGEVVILPLHRMADTGLERAARKAFAANDIAERFDGPARNLDATPVRTWLREHWPAIVLGVAFGLSLIAVPAIILGMR